MPKKISIIIPAYNEEANLRLVYNRLKEVLVGLKQYNHEIIFVDDGSSDGSVEILKAMSLVDPDVKFIEFSRNFGKEIATSAGLEYSGGDATIMIDADLQHPVELIPEFLTKWEAGADIVVGVRNKNRGEGLIKKVGSFVYYKLINAVAETKIIPRATDFRLLDKKVVSEFKRFTERSRITRGLIDWMGFKRDFIYFTANERENGEAKYNIFKLFKLAISSFVSHSLLPLKIAGYFGTLIVMIFGPFGFYIFIAKYFFHDPFASSFSGPAQLAILIIFLVGIILASLGLVALYIANIQKEVVNRPLFVIRNTNIGEVMKLSSYKVLK